MKIRALERSELDEIWSIDRAELVERVYVREGDTLVLRDERHDVKGWPPGEADHYGPILRDCFERGGAFYAAFDDAGTLVGLAVLESRFIGRARDQLQLKFLHVSRSARRTGLGRTLFEKAVERARELGARRLYVSATPSENTIGFYLRRGCRLAEEIDAELFALEPEDIHLELAIPPRVVA
jgi:predicted N-acetyltransferase YhbS